MQGKGRAEITGSPPGTSDSSLPSAALPASGSRGLRQNTGLSATRLPRIYLLQNRTGPAQVNCAHNGPLAKLACRAGCSRKLSEQPGEGGCEENRPSGPPIGRTRPAASSDYCAAFSSFTLVWKMACHPPFSFFQTDPALKVPE